MSGVRHSEITLHCDPLEGLTYKVLLGKGQPLRTLMSIQGVLQHLSPMKLVMKSFPLNAECVGSFSCSKLDLCLAWAPTRAGRRQGLKKVVIVVADTQLQPGEQWSDGNMGYISQGEAWDDGCFTLGNTSLSDGPESCFSLLFTQSLSYLLLTRCFLLSVPHKSSAF